MHVAARAMFGALARGLEERPDLFDRVRLHLVGTHYARGDDGAKTFEPIADELGLQGRVREYPQRVPYFTALELLRQADMLLVPGSTAAGYTASKLYPYILARRPMLAVFDERSSVVDVLSATKAAEPVTFGARESLEQRTYERWCCILERLPFTPPTDWTAFEPYTARAMTKRQVDVFNQVVNAR
jgi:hypothetical protein